MAVRAGEVVFWQAYTFSYWQGAVVVITEVPADSKKTIDAQVVFAHIEGSKGKWERGSGPAHLSRSDVRWVYRGDHQLDVDTLNSKDVFDTLWHQIDPDTVAFVPGRHDSIDPTVARVQRMAHLLKQNYPAYASMIHDFGDASECTTFVSSFTYQSSCTATMSQEAFSGSSPPVSDLIIESDGSVRSSFSNLCSGEFFCRYQPICFDGV
jgi:hypothetical protein